MFRIEGLGSPGLGFGEYRDPGLGLSGFRVVGVYGLGSYGFRV